MATAMEIISATWRSLVVSVEIISQSFSRRFGAGLVQRYSSMTGYRRRSCMIDRCIQNISILWNDEFLIAGSFTNSMRADDAVCEGVAASPFVRSARSVEQKFQTQKKAGSCVSRPFLHREGAIANANRSRRHRDPSSTEVSASDRLAVAADLDRSAAVVGGSGRLAAVAVECAADSAAPVGDSACFVGPAADCSGLP